MLNFSKLNTNTVRQTALFSCLAILLLFYMSACKYNPNESLEWDTDLLVPIATADVSISDVLNDTSLVVENGDNSLSIVYRDTILNSSVSDFVTVPDTVIQKTFTLDSLRLDSDTIEQSVSLGFIANRLKQQGNPVGNLLLGADGDTLAFMPAIQNVGSGPVEVDATEFFEFAELRSGEIEISIYNGFPIDIEDVRFVLKNKNFGDTILFGEFPLIPKYTSASETFDLSDKTVESALVGELTRLNTVADTDVPVDTSDQISFFVAARKLQATNATAIFPSQTVVDSQTVMKYKFPPEYGDIEITKIGVKSGGIVVEGISTIQDTIAFFYELTSATRNGSDPAKITRKMDPAPPGDTSYQYEYFDLSGFTMDMTGGPGYNHIQQHYKIDLIYSGKIVNIDLSDSIYVYFGLVDIVPAYVEGYIGSSLVQFEGQEAVDFLETLEVGGISFANPSAQMTFVNSIGVDAQIDVNELRTTNTQTGNSVALSGSLIDNPLIINSPSLPDTFGEVATVFDLNTSNSNISEFLSALGNQWEYDLSINANYNGMPGVRDNFATDRSSVSLLMDFELPLEGSVQQLVLADTVGLNFTEEAVGEVDQIKDGSLNLLIDNEFPFEVNVEAVIYDETWNPVDTIANNAVGGNIIQAGLVDNNTGMVIEPTRSTVIKSFTTEELKEILAIGKHLRLRFTLDTRPTGVPVKIFSNYKVKAKLVGEFGYEVGF